MNMAFGHARYADELERTLYNGALCGVSLKGDTYTYQNPLEADTSRARWEWHECPCCPPMFLKFMGAMPGYVYATDADNVYVNLFVASLATIPMKGGKVVLRQQTKYPWDGAVRIEVAEAPAGTTGLMLRIPAWCRGEKLTVNGKTQSTQKRVRGYVAVAGKVSKGDIIELTLPMPVEQVRANPQVMADAGKVAIMRGPVVYCLESADNGPQVRGAVVRNPELAASYRAELLQGVVTVEGSALMPSEESWQGGLYYTKSARHAAAVKKITAIPFYANGNRGPVEMTMWLPEEA
jgi:DUF1680 family protein